MNRQEFLNKLFAAAAAAGIAESEAYIAGGENTSVEILDGQIKEYSAAKSEGLCFRGVYEGRMGYASTEEMDEDAIEMLVTAFGKTRRFWKPTTTRRSSRARRNTRRWISTARKRRACRLPK